MRVHEIIEGMNGGLNGYVASVRAVVAVSITSKVRFEVDSLNSAKSLQQLPKAQQKYAQVSSTAAKSSMGGQSLCLRRGR